MHTFGTAGLAASLDGASPIITAAVVRISSSVLSNTPPSVSVKAGNSVPS
ncbi:MAG: hypothetical protein Q620_VSAC01265G0001 [Veillonella sp. DORA_A_3_16_22]|nr:MAG: hypothetical protein Q620_VSAC01265G0001 [Veillonella sp. DORA_A_3_16_22]